MKKIDQLKLYAMIQVRGNMWDQIARQSGEVEKQDIQHDALIFVSTLWKSEQFGPFDSDNEAHWKYLYAVMHNRLVKYTEKNIKYAEKLDHPAKNNPDASTHPLLVNMMSASSTEPLQCLINQKDQQRFIENQQKQIKQTSFSLALAYVQLFEQLKTRIINHIYLNIASHMNMSYSWLRRCLIHAEKQQKIQSSLCDGIEQTDDIKHLGSWRKFKIIRNSSKSAPVARLNQLRLFQ